MLLALLQHPGRAFSREELLAQVWQDGRATSSNVVEVYIRYLRQKLEEQGSPGGAHRSRPWVPCRPFRGRYLNSVDYRLHHSSCRSRPVGVWRRSCVDLEEWHARSAASRPDAGPRLPAYVGCGFLTSPGSRFWMFNTIAPLDMLFLRGGTVIAIAREVPAGMPGLSELWAGSALGRGGGTGGGADPGHQPGDPAGETIQ